MLYVALFLFKLLNLLRNGNMIIKKLIFKLFGHIEIILVLIVRYIA